MLSRSNIAYNLHASPHFVEVVYETQTVIYHFSSELYTEKFRARMGEHREEINNSLSNRFGVNIHSNILADLRLYRSIEKRGYLISVNGEQFECQNNITLDGLKLITKS